MILAFFAPDLPCDSTETDQEPVEFTVRDRRSAQQAAPTMISRNIVRALPTGIVTAQYFLNRKYRHSPASQLAFLIK
jgi:hypothetical protein